MRHILQEIFERYLRLEPAAFDTSPLAMTWGREALLRTRVRPHKNKGFFDFPRL